METKDLEREKLIEVLGGLNPAPEAPLGVVIDGATYGIVAKGDYVWAEVTRDGVVRQYEVAKRECLDVETICEHAVWYDGQEDPETAWACVAEALHRESALPDAGHHCRVWRLGGLLALKCGDTETAYNLMNHALILPDCTDEDAIALLEQMARLLDADGQHEAAEELRRDAERRG